MHALLSRDFTCTGRMHELVLASSESLARFTYHGGTRHLFLFLVDSLSACQYMAVG